MIQLKLFRKFIVYIVMGLFIIPSKTIKDKTLLIIRLDAIGDYVLFRNFIEEIKNTTQYREYKVTLLGNDLWKSLAEELDSKYVDEFIWIDRNRFNQDFRYRFLTLKEVVSKGYEVVISPVYSREYFFADTFVRLINANVKIGSIGDLSTIRKWQKILSDTYYTYLTPVSDESMFEFSRNKEFFENVLGRNIDLQKPVIKLKPKRLNYNLSDSYAVLFIGSSANSKKWNIKNFATIAKHLTLRYGMQIILCGGPADKEDANEFTNYFNDDYLDLVGKTSLLDLLHIIYKSRILISNDTSAPHCAVALNVTNIFVIYNGNHYGRFIPYPKEISENHHVIYHPKIEEDLAEGKKLSNIYRFGSHLDINAISVEQVIGKIDLVFNAGSKNE